MTRPVRPRAPLRETRLETPRTARVCYLGGEGARPPAELWYLLHGYGQRADRFLDCFWPLASAERLLVAPEALARFYRSRAGGGHSGADRVGASWMTRIERESEIRDYVRYLDLVARHSEHGTHGPSRTVLGFSQGAHTAARWVLLGRIRAARLILWGAGLPRDLPSDAAARLAGTCLILVRGKGDALRRREEEAADERWLERAGIDYALRVHDGGHEIVSDLLPALAGPRGA